MPKSPHTHGRSEVWERSGSRAAIDEARRRLAERLRTLRESRGLTQEIAAERAGIHAKHLQRLERGTANVTVATLSALALAYGQPLGSFFEIPRSRGLPLRPLDPLDVRPYKNGIPLYSLRAAAGRFGDPQLIEHEENPQAWVVPLGRTRPGRGLFVAQVVGTSMDRRIPDGAFCVFRTPVRRAVPGGVYLFQLRDARDPEHGGRYTVKLLRRERGKVWLEPASSDAVHRPIEVVEADDVVPVGEMVEVLG